MTETVKTDDFTMEYFKFGEGDKPLVIIPGLGIQSVMCFADAVADAYRLLTEDYTIYVFERRNELPQSFSVFDTARDTAEAIRAIGLGRVSILGASYGGMASMAASIRYPELVDKMILASTSACVTEEEFKTVDSWISLAKEENAEKLYLAFGEALYPKEIYEKSKDVLIDAAKAVTKEDLERFITLAEGIKGFDVTDDLNLIKCPVFVIGDRQDRVFGAAATENIARYMKKRSDFKFYMYDGYGHAVYDTAPDFKERILNFLRQKND